MQCTCPHLKVGLKVLEQRAWDELCPVHGVGTPYFQALPKMPFGFAEERWTTREEYLAALEEAAEEAAREEARWYDDLDEEERR